MGGILEGKLLRKFSHTILWKARNSETIILQEYQTKKALTIRNVLTELTNYS